MQLHVRVQKAITLDGKSNFHASKLRHDDHQKLDLHADAVVNSISIICGKLLVYLITYTAYYWWVHCVVQVCVP